MQSSISARRLQTQPQRREKAFTRKHPLTSKDGRVVALERMFEQVAAEVVEQGLLRSVRGVVFRAGGPVRGRK